MKRFLYAFLILASLCAFVPSTDAQFPINVAGFKQPAGGGGGTLIRAINAGGDALDGYESGTAYRILGDNFTDGAAITTTALTDVPSQSVLQSYTYRNATSPVEYEVTGLNNTPHTVRVFLWSDSGVGTQDITINGVLVENDIDVATVAGGTYRAIQRDYAVTPTTGVINIQIAAATGYALFSAFKIIEN